MRDVVEECCEGVCVCGCGAGLKWGDVLDRCVRLEVWKGVSEAIFLEVGRENAPESGKEVEDGDLGAELLALGQFAVFAVAAMPRWISDRTSGVCVTIFVRRARVMPFLRGAMAWVMLERSNNVLGKGARMM